MTVAVRTLADQVWAMQQAITNITHYRGRVGDNPPKDSYGAVNAYTVLYPGAGVGYSRRLARSVPTNLDWTFQITCVGGDDTRCLWCVDKVRAAFTGARLGNRRIRELGESGVIRRDDDVSPPRFFVPLDFGVYVAG